MRLALPDQTLSGTAFTATHRMGSGSTLKSAKQHTFTQSPATLLTISS